MIRLKRITLLNWYRFTAIDIPVDEMSILLLGLNGAGKSSLIDGVHSIIVGGDEGILRLNATGNKDNSPGRSLKSYALGIIKDSESEGIYKPRITSNSYLAITFEDEKGNESSACLSLYAHKNHKDIEKNQFLLHGTGLAKDDFMDREERVLPWSDLKMRLQGYDKARLELFDNSTMKRYRQQFAEMISAPSYTINADQLIRTLKAGLTFQTNIPISEFIRRHILPEIPLDISNLRTLRRQHVEIAELIDQATTKLRELNIITGEFVKREKCQSSIINNQWIAQEAQRLYLGEQADNNIDIVDQIVEREGAVSKEISQLKSKKPIVENDLRSALSAFENNDETVLIKRKTEELEQLGHDYELQKSAILTVKKNLLTLTNKNKDDAISLNSSYLVWVKLASQLREVVCKNKFLDAWPNDEEHTKEIINYTHNLLEASSIVSEETYKSKVSGEEKQAEFDLLSESIRNLSQGGSSLTQETSLLQKILINEKIQSTPVCDMVEIKDKKWQQAIESFLGMNREALVVDDKDAERAINIYRREIKNNRNLRKCKIINPHKSIHKKRIVEKGAASELLSYEHPIAEIFLSGFLYNLILVETEKELVAHKRAITPDGVIAANGAIGGVRLQDILLFGRDARISSAETLKTKLELLAKDIVGKKNEFLQLNQLNNLIVTNKSSILKEVNRLGDRMSEIVTIDNASKNIKVEMANANTAEYDSLLKEKKRAEQAMEDHSASIEILIKESGTLATRKEVAESNLREAEKEIEEHAKNMELWLSENDVDLSVASQEYAKKEEKNDDLIKLKYDAEKTVDLSKLRLSKIENDITEMRINYLNNHMKNSNPLQDTTLDQQRIKFIEWKRTLEESELPLRQDDAEKLRDKMLETFRTEVTLKLRQLFEGMKMHFIDLDKQLKGRVFHGQTYSFQRFKIDDDDLNTLSSFVQKTDENDDLNTNSLFDTNTNHKALDVIDRLLQGDDFSELTDYRNYFSYDIKLTDQNDKKSTQLLSKIRGTQSGGEFQTPFYIALGAAFGNAFKLRIHTSEEKGTTVFGGAAFAIFDEAFSNMDGNNASSAMAFFKEMGLQVIIAGPPESEIKVYEHADKVLNMVRHGGSVTIDYRAMKKKAFDIMAIDDPELHPEILETYIAEVEDDREKGLID